MATAAERLHRRGIAALDAGHPAESERHLRAAMRHLDEAGAVAEIADDAHLRTRILLTMAVVAFDRSGVRAAEAVLDRADRAARTTAAADLVALCASQRANLLLRAGRAADSLPHLDVAVAAVDDLPSRDGCIVLLNRGVARAEQGDLDGARDDLVRSEGLAREHGLADWAFMAQHNRGWVAYLAGDLPGALATMQAADASEAPVSRGIALLDQGRVLLEAGLLDDAVDVLERAVELCATDGQRHAVAEAELAIATGWWVRGEADRAIDLARRARDRFARRGEVVWAARARLLVARCQLARSRQLGHALATVERVADGARVRSDLGTRREALVVRAAVQGGLGRPHDAARSLAEARGSGGPAPTVALSGRLEETWVEASVAASTGDLARAENLLRAAAEQLLAGSAVASTLELQAARQVHGRALATLDLRLGRQGTAADLLAAMERWRGMSRRLPPVARTASPELAQVLADLRRAREELRAEGTDATSARVVELERQATERARAGPGDRRDLRPVVPVEVLVESLDATGSDLLATVVIDDGVEAVAVVDGQLRRGSLGPAEDLHALARRVRTDLAALGRHHGSEMEAAVTRSLDAGVEQLRDRLLGALELGGRRLVVAPHAELAGLPWLRMVRGAGVVVASSATAWWQGLQSAPTGAPGEEPAVRTIRGPRLQHAADECRGVRGAWGASGEGGNVATAEGLREALQHADVVHVAAHGTHVADSPMFSRVELDDGPLFLHDLEEGGVRASHVVLASCDVGRATVRPGEEPLGLAVGMLSLGARSVVAASCPVPDVLVPPVMAAHHAGLVRGVPSDQALADAVAAAPAAAAAFVVAGSPWQRPHPETPGVTHLRYGFGRATAVEAGSRGQRPRPR